MSSELQDIYQNGFSFERQPRSGFKEIRGSRLSSFMRVTRIGERHERLISSVDHIDFKRNRIPHI